MVDVILNKTYLPHSLNTSDDLIRIIQFTSSQFITNSSCLCQKEKKKKKSNILADSARSLSGSFFVFIGGDHLWL